MRQRRTLLTTLNAPYDHVLKYHTRRDSRDHGKFLGRGRISVKMLDSWRASNLISIEVISPSSDHTSPSFTRPVAARYAY